VRNLPLVAIFGSAQWRPGVVEEPALLEISGTDLIQQRAELVEGNGFHEVGVEPGVVSAFNVFFHAIAAQGDRRQPNGLQRRAKNSRTPQRGVPTRQKKFDREMF
jgi:hypothetical protein